MSEDFQPGDWEDDVAELEELDRVLPDGLKLDQLSDEERRSAIEQYLPHLKRAGDDVR